MNIVVNALDAVAPRGNVQLSVTHEATSVSIDVMDDGAGIRPEDLGRVLEPFFTTKRTGEGTGLGLAIAAEIVRDHGGELTIASSLGVGTRVRIRLPIVDGTAPEPGARGG
jgi:signal transduction histidine kinase